jgi:hypothetical protein
MFQPTNNKKKHNNLGLPPQPPSLEELADEQEPLVMVAGGVNSPVSTLSNKSPTSQLIVPNIPVLAADEVSVTPVQAGASIEHDPVLAADEVSTPVQTGVGIKQDPVLAADEVSVTPVQAGASIEHNPVLAADEVSNPVQTGVGIEHDPVLAADEVLTPVQTGVDIELPPEEASASLQLWVPIADDALTAPVPVGVSTDVSAQALPVTEFIHGEPEPVVVGPLQPLPF